MEGYGGDLSGDINNYGYTSTNPPLAPGPPPTLGSLSIQPYVPQSESDLGGAPGTSLQEELQEGIHITSGGGGGRKKKKKHKSGDDPSTKSMIMTEEELVDAAIPVLSETQGAGVEELAVGAPLAPSGGTMIGGQYLNNTLLDHILTQKKMQILQSPEVVEFLKSQMNKK